MDHSKAFDHMSHIILLKNTLYGILKRTNALVTDYFNERLKMLNVNGIVSDWIQVKRGALQGMVLYLMNVLCYNMKMSVQCLHQP